MMQQLEMICFAWSKVRCHHLRWVSFLCWCGLQHWCSNQNVSWRLQIQLGKCKDQSLMIHGSRKSTDWLVHSEKIFHICIGLLLGTNHCWSGIPMIALSHTLLWGFCKMCLMRGHVYMTSALVLGGPLQPPTAWRLCFIGDLEDLVLWKKVCFLNAQLQFQEFCWRIFHHWMMFIVPLGCFRGPKVFGAGFAVLLLGRFQQWWMMQWMVLLQIPFNSSMLTLIQFLNLDFVLGYIFWVL